MYLLGGVLLLLRLGGLLVLRISLRGGDGLLVRRILLLGLLARALRFVIEKNMLCNAHMP